MSYFELNSEQRLDAPLEEVFAFFADPANLETLTPPWLHFSIDGYTDTVMRAGTEIDYRLRVRGVPIRWRSRITRWEPPFSFVDEQLRGPYRLWRHLHTFERDGDATIARDRVEYAVPGGALVDRLFVRRDLRRIFEFRRERMREIFQPAAAEAIGV